MDRLDLLVSWPVTQNLSIESDDDVYDVNGVWLVEVLRPCPLVVADVL